MKALFIIQLLAICCSRPELESTDSSDIMINITGVKNRNGLVFINLYNAPRGFPKEMPKAMLTIKITPNIGTTKATFKNIQKGIYAVAVMHDENNNGKMDTNFLGIPIEGYCVSNNVKGFMSAPSFADAAFELKSTTTQTLKMIY